MFSNLQAHSNKTSSHPPQTSSLQINQNLDSFSSPTSKTPMNPPTRNRNPRTRVSKLFDISCISRMSFKSNQVITTLMKFELKSLTLSIKSLTATDLSTQSIKTHINPDKRTTTSFSEFTKKAALKASTNTFTQWSSKMKPPSWSWTPSRSSSMRTESECAQFQSTRECSLCFNRFWKSCIWTSLSYTLWIWSQHEKRSNWA